MTSERTEHVEEVFEEVLERDTPATLDPTRTDVDRNAAGGSWEGAGEVVESDYEAEQLRIRQAEGEGGLRHPDEGEPHERLRK